MVVAKSPERLVFDPILNKLDNIENIVAILLFKMDNFRSYFIYFSQISLLIQSTLETLRLSIIGFQINFASTTAIFIIAFFAINQVIDAFRNVFNQKSRKKDVPHIDVLIVTM